MNNEMMQLTVKEFGEAIDRIVQTGNRRSILALGASGIGKSEVVFDTTQKYGWGFKDLRLLLYTETDIKGIPYPSEDGTTTKWLPNDILPNEERDGKEGILVIEELTSASKKTQAAAYQLIQDRRLGDYIVPEGWLIVALGNREADDGVFVRMPAPLTNRFSIVEVVPDLGAFKEWAFKKEVSEYVISYLNFDPIALHTFSPDDESMIFASPRSWKAVSDIIRAKKDISDLDKIDRALITGNIGTGIANKFFSYIELSSELPCIEDILDGNHTSAPSKPDLVYLLIGSIVSHMHKYIKDVDSIEDLKPGALKRIQNVFDYFVSMPTDFAVVGMRDLCVINKPLMGKIIRTSMNTQKFVDFITENAYIFD